MALDENKLADEQAWQALQARLMEKKRERGIPELASPKQEQSQSAEPDPLANLNEPAKHFLDSLPDAVRERSRNNLTKDIPEGAEPVGSIASGLMKEIPATARAPASGSEERTPGRYTAARRPTRSRESAAKSEKPGKSWGMLFASLVATPEYQSLRARDYRVLSVLITSRDNRNGGECAPGFGKIETVTRLSSRTIDRSLSQLANRGIIRQVRKAHVGQNAAFIIAEDGEEIARNLRERATPSIGALSTPESTTPNIGAQ